MKKRVWLSVLLGLLLVMASPGLAASKTTIQVNNQTVTLKEQTHVVHNRTLVAATDMEALFKAKVTTNQSVCTVKAGKVVLEFKLNQNLVKKDKKWIKIDQGAIVRNKKVYFPLRWTAEQLGYTIKWDGNKGVIVLEKGEPATDGKVITNDQLTADEKKFVDEVKEKKGIHQKGNLYVIARGEVPNPGYGIEVVKLVQSWEQLYVHVKLTSPKPDMMYAQVISYPYVLLRIDTPKYTTVTFVNADTGKPLFTEE